MGAAARRTVEASYSLDATLPTLADVLGAAIRRAARSMPANR
jgi:hypothetical protein